MKDNIVYLGLGGNVGNTRAILSAAIDDICMIEGLRSFELSSFYRTPPVSDIPQDDYLNAVCRIVTINDLNALFASLQYIESKYGKGIKPKNAPRKIDIDVLFFNDSIAMMDELQVPHPRWRERLFVLIPLLELIERIQDNSPGGVPIKEIEKLIKTYPEKERQMIIKLC